ncbi:I78 family peptidase inhibitor [Altericroceibacterium xinjiangense]|uniref:I78 family peptidase inhibitor n=1 Tax=Altericroceibacterium xinjiangense TaxID=762261 RepID=UPI001F4997BD|nr:I78 family peptidase inhibitor [Altericroceibacterium xinjiangense]
MVRTIKPTLALAGAALLTGCATATSLPASSEDPPIRRAPDTCKAEPGQRFIGQKASPQTGAALLAATGSRELRWLPPETMVTAEYKHGRLTVAYDRDYTITRVNCG